MRKTFIAALAFSALTAFGLSNCSSDDNNKGHLDDARQEGTITINTFDHVKTAFAEGESQSAEGTFNFPEDVHYIESIKMYLEDFCPDKSCDEWDRYANIYAKDKETETWIEIGRFITPYWVGTEKLDRGLEFDVTDFKSLLTGETELKIYTETWLAKGRTYSLSFDFNYGETDYLYSKVVPVIQYNRSSIDGVPYGKSHNFEMSKQVQMPSDIEAAHLRTIISGWGHATPQDFGGRGCAEWCFRTHHILINGEETYEHYLGPLGCADNPINNQNPGNWTGDRAGWCPGMIVPVRKNELNNNLFGNTFEYAYQFEDWTNNNRNGEAYYAISTLLVLKSNKPIKNLAQVN